ncbi:MAG: serine/threonine protein kinase [Alphaproteobacteria bacterium]|nr:serine/threonine protein kinase [Alphaproteobacteria bacterium]
MSEDTPRTRYCSRCLTTFDGDPDACPNLSCRTKRKRDGWGTLLRDGDVLDRHYKIERCLAIGGAGVTYLAHELGDDDQPTGPALAIKVLYSHRDHGPYLKRLATEAQILQELEHPNIVKMMGFVNRAGRSPYLLTRFEAGGSLLDHLRRVGPMRISTVAGMGVQLCEALELAHDKGVIHRDLKPENILLAREAGAGEVPLARLTDFGIAKVSSSIGDRLTRVGAFVGTPQYAAPEQFAGREPSAATDLFSLAAVLWFCITLEPLTPPDLIMDPVEALSRLERRLPVSVREGGTTLEIASFNTFLAATMAPLAEERVGVAQARDMLQAILLGTPVKAPKADEPGNETMPVPLGMSASITMDPPTGEASFLGEEEEAPTTLSRDPDAPDAETAMAEDAAPPELAEPAAPNATGGWTAPPLLPPIEREAPKKPEKKPRKGRSGGRGLMLLVAGGMFLGIVGVAGLGLAWYAAPSKLPAPLRDALPRTVLSPGNPAHAAEIQALSAHFAQHTADARRRCGIPEGATVVVDLTVEPTGRVRRYQAQGLDATQSACLWGVLEPEVFPRSGLEAVRLALTLGR